MSHQGEEAILINHRVIKQVLDRFIAPALLASFRTRTGAKWKPRLLAAVALLWATSAAPNLTDRFKKARKVVIKIFRWQPEPGTSYQGFMKMLAKWHDDLMRGIVPHVRANMKAFLSRQWTVAGYTVFAGDGSRVELARTESLEKTYSPQRKKKRKKMGKRRGRRGRAKPAKTQSAAAIAKKANSPQMWLTLLWHVGTGLPWAWRTGPSDSSERGHLEEMLAELPENSLITADAGFVGFDFWSAILNAGHHFVIRVGANVRLIRKLGYARQYEDTVYLWPDQAAKKKQPPLTLRLIVIENGAHPMYLITNLSKSQLNNRQAVAIYAARWGIELFFRTFKQTFGRRKLRSRSARNARLELDWSLLALWCACLLGQHELTAARRDPTRLSPAGAITAIQDTLTHYRVRPESTEETLWTRLQNAHLDDYQRTGTKTSRNYPRKNKRKCVGAPKITNATKQQITAAARLKNQRHEFRLTA
jgi:hypothetical protein